MTSTQTIVTSLPTLPIEQHISFTTSSVRTAVYTTWSGEDRHSDVVDRSPWDKGGVFYCQLGDRDLWLNHEGRDLYRAIEARINAEAGPC